MLLLRIRLVSSLLIRRKNLKKREREESATNSESAFPKRNFSSRKKKEKLHNDSFANLLRRLAPPFLSSFPPISSPPLKLFRAPPIKLVPPSPHFPVHGRRLGSGFHEQKGKRGVLVRIPIQLQTSVQLVAARAYDNVGQGGEGSESAGRLRGDRESVGSVSVRYDSRSGK